MLIGMYTKDGDLELGGSTQARAEVLHIPSVRHVAMETGKPALVVWIGEHAQEYGLGLLNGFISED